MSTATESDDELLASLEPGSFAVFYRRQVEDLVAFFMRRTRSAELAADITETANKWARHFAASPQTCTDYMSRTACEQVTCQRVGGTPNCRAATPQWAAEFRGATVQKIAISGDRAAATLSNGQTVQLRRIATGEWLIDRLGPIGAVGSSN